MGNRVILSQLCTHSLRWNIPSMWICGHLPQSRASSKTWTAWSTFTARLQKQRVEKKVTDRLLNKRAACRQVSPPPHPPSNVNLARLLQDEVNMSMNSSSSWSDLSREDVLEPLIWAISSDCITLLHLPLNCLNFSMLITLLVKLRDNNFLELSSTWIVSLEESCKQLLTGEGRGWAPKMTIAYKVMWGGAQLN